MAVDVHTESIEKEGGRQDGLSVSSSHWVIYVSCVVPLCVQRWIKDDGDLYSTVSCSHYHTNIEAPGRDTEETATMD